MLVVKQICETYKDSDEDFSDSGDDDSSSEGGKGGNQGLSNTTPV